jgi:hypothetical protein
MFAYLILLGIAALISFLAWIIILAKREYQYKRQFRQALDREQSKRDTIWKEARAITDMVNLYMGVVCKHGPNSPTAKAFRFGTDSKLMKKLHGDDEAMEAFNQQCDIIDATYRQAVR